MGEETQTLLSPGRARLTTQHYLVLVVCILGWLCDCLDSALFVMVQENALEDLMNSPSNKELSRATAVIYALQLIGGSVGGVVVGILCDKYGRSTMLLATVLVYSIGTALCAVVQTWWQLAILRFITGIGTGGEWATGASLLSEVWPNSYRTTVGPILQAGGSLGSIIGALVYMAIHHYGWRYVFVAGVFPAIILITLRFFVDESEMWKQGKKDINTLSEIFSKKYFSDTVSVGLLVAVKLFVYYAVVVWIPSVMRDELKHFPQENWTLEEADDLAGYAYILINLGGFAGNLSWIYTADRYGRKGTIAYMMLGMLIVLPPMFSFVHDVNTLLVLMPVLGFFVAGFAGGLAIWLPELYPTAIRGTGTAFIYNSGRLVGALGPMTTAALVGITGTYYGAVAMMPMFLIVGILSLLFARETMNAPLE